MNKIIIAIVIVLVVVIGATNYFRADTTNEPAGSAATEQQEAMTYFANTLLAKAKSSIKDYEKLGLGEAVDGFTLLTIYPNLKPSDFADVPAYQGVYSVVDGKLTYTGNAASNSAVLMEAGMNSLLKNVSTRLNIPVTRKADVDSLIVKMSANEPVTARINEVASSLGIYVTPLEVIEDSRCPANANCIQAGTVRIKALLESGSGKAPQTFKLNEPITTETREVTLVQVDPQSQAGVKIKNADYLFYFEIKSRE